jgi:hypothetical protein
MPSATAGVIESVKMLKDQPTRREVLAGMAAVSLFPSSLKSESSGSSLCFMSAVEMAYAFEQATGFGKKRPAIA